MSNTIRSFKGKYKFLSNFYPVFVNYGGIRFPSVEHAFQAAKSDDVEVRKLFAIAPTAKEAKRFGKQVKLTEGWDTKKISIMKSLLKQKFNHEPLRSMLLDTEDSILIEGNNHNDKFWGQVNGEGMNILGKLLMEVRDDMKKEEQIKE